MKKQSAILVGVILGVLVARYAWAQPALVVDQTYTCRGTAPQGKTYTLDLRLTKQGAQTYRLTYSNDTHGIGFLDARGSLVAVYITPVNSVGAVSFRIERGRLLGRWSAGDGMVYDENCSIGKAAD